MKKSFWVLSLVLISALLLDTMAVSGARGAPPEPGNKVSGLLSLQVSTKLKRLRGELLPSQADVLRLPGAAAGKLNSQLVYIHFPAEPTAAQKNDLAALGVTLYPDSWLPPVGSHPTGFMLAEMPLEKLASLAAKGYIARLDTAERTLKPMNDLAAQYINADDVWSSYNGTGVRVAILDSGLDVGHADLPSLLAYKDYSNYPTSTDDTIANTVTGHGTHVTGSVLGRGTQSGGVYKGMAPDAGLIFLKIGNDSSGSASTNAIVGALHAAVDTYDADIINISYGGWDAFHDGTSQEAQAVDYAVSQGATVFVAAGNDADNGRHYSGTVAGNSSTGFIQVDVTGAGSQDTALYFNLVWYDGTSVNNDLILKYYDGMQTELTDISNLGQDESDRGTEQETSFYNSYVVSGDSTFYLKVRNNSVNTQAFHIYEIWGANVAFNSPDSYYTIASPADADSAIAVGAETTRKVWWDYENDGWQWSYETVGQIATFSNRGPRVDTGAPPKPNIVAPGAGIISLRDDDVYTWPLVGLDYTYYNDYCIDNDAPNSDNDTANNDNGPADYYLMLGTSMASPVAAGIGALILDKNPTWNPAQVKHALQKTATENGTAGLDNTFGWGLVNALAAVNASLPPAASYSDAAYTVPNDNFDSFASEHSVYMLVTGLLPSYPYRVAYYDGGNTKRATEDVVSTASGNLTSQHTFLAGTDVAGTWHAVICEGGITPPSSYNATWAYTIAEDTFTVEQTAIPEFPTVLAAIVALALSGGVYIIMRRKVVAASR